MGLNILDANLIALLALGVSATTGYLTYRATRRRDDRTADLAKSKDDKSATLADTQEAIEGYAKLCDALERRNVQLTQRISDNETKIDALRSQLDALEGKQGTDRSSWGAERAELIAKSNDLQLQMERIEAQHNADRVRWDSERARLEGRIVALQKENVELRQLIDAERSCRQQNENMARGDGQ